MVSLDTHPQLGTQDAACGHRDPLGVLFQPLHSLQAFWARKARLSPALCTFNLPDLEAGWEVELRSMIISGSSLILC